jgi:pheromone alpha factor receptor
MPAIFSTIQFYQPIIDKFPEVGTMVITVLCVFLPLSAIWAGVANESAIAYRGPDAHHHLINSQFGRGVTATATSSSTTAFDKGRQMSCSTCSYVKKGDDFDILEYSLAGKRSMAGDDGIHVDRKYTVRHEATPLEHV